MKILPVRNSLEIRLRCPSLHIRVVGDPRHHISCHLPDISHSPDIPPAAAPDLDELHHLLLLHAELPVAEGAVVGQHAVQARLRVRSEAQTRLPHTVIIGLITRLSILQNKENEKYSALPHCPPAAASCPGPHLNGRDFIDIRA